MENSDIITLKVRDYPIQIKRIDKWIVDVFLILELTQQDDLTVKTSFSRTKVKELILSGCVSVDGILNKNPSYKINDHNIITITLPETVNYNVEPENIPLDIIFEDEHLLVINKQANFVVHPSPGHNTGTLVNAVLHHCKGNLSGIGGIRRPGIVHRLDKDTSGLMLVAKSERAHLNLSEMFKEHSIKRIYKLIVWNVPESKGTVSNPIGRSKFNRKKMGINSNGKMAVTHWRLIKVFSNLVSLISCNLETGRTHQIRVHMTSIGHPIVGDKIYGNSPSKNKKYNFSEKKIIEVCDKFTRQALHSSNLSFEHPISKQKMNFEVNLPNDMKELIDTIT